MDDSNLQVFLAAASSAVAKGLSDYDVAREKKATDKATSAEISVALHRLKDGYANRREVSLGMATGAIGSYCSKARKLSLEAIAHDPRMPRLINYGERYNAFLGMTKRADVLRRIEQTIDLADMILAQRDQVDPDSALKEVAQDYVERVLRLNGIEVVDAEVQVEDKTSSNIARDTAGKTDNSFDRTIEQAFLSALSDLGEDENGLIAQMGETLSHASSLARSLPEAVDTAMDIIKKEEELAATAIAGNTLLIPKPAPFEEPIVVESDADAELLVRLSTLVRKSYKTFAQIVRDNGLFSAFSHEPSYGACSGWKFGFWLDDFLYDMSEYVGDIPGRKQVADIPDTVEEDEDGDTLERTIERMEEFNKRRYFGMLDDDFDEHVDAFWYGFKKLMLGVNGLFRLNPSEFNAYCNDVAEAAKQATVELGAASMDKRQLDAFCNEVKERGREDASE